MIYLILFIGITLSSYLFFRFTYLICVHNDFMFSCLFYIPANNLLIIDVITIFYLILLIGYMFFKFNINVRDWKWN
jgi:hypothetical protein